MQRFCSFYWKDSFVWYIYYKYEIFFFTPQGSHIVLLVLLCPSFQHGSNTFRPKMAQMSYFWALWRHKLVLSVGNFMKIVLFLCMIFCSTSTKKSVATLQTRSFEHQSEKDHRPCWSKSINASNINCVKKNISY